MQSEKKEQKPPSKFIILWGIVAGLMASFSASRNKIPIGLVNILQEAFMWGIVFWATIFTYKYLLGTIEFFKKTCGCIDNKSALLGLLCCVASYVLMVFLIPFFKI